MKTPFLAIYKTASDMGSVAFFRDVRDRKDAVKQLRDISTSLYERADLISQQEPGVPMWIARNGRWVAQKSTMRSA